MEFHTKTERKHPQEKLIPESLWEDHRLFNQNLPNHLISLMQAEGETALLACLASSTQCSSGREKQCTWLAIALSHPELSPETLEAIGLQLGLSEIQIFQSATLWDNKDYFQFLITKHEQQGSLKALIASENYEAFRSAAKHGCFEILHYLESKVSLELLQDMIAAESFEAFRCAAQKGLLETLRYLESKINPEALQAMIAAKAFEAFRYAAWKGLLEVLHYLESKVSPGILQAMIAANRFEAFRYAAGCGHLEVLDYLESKVSPELLQTMIAAENSEAFRCAARFCQLVVLHYLESKVSPEVLQTMIAAENFEAFRYAAQEGYTEVLHYLENKVSSEVLQTMIAAGSFEAFRSAARFGNLQVIRYLESKVNPTMLQDMIATQNYRAFRTAASCNYPDTVHYLLLHNQVFAYAEEHVQEYACYINPFVSEQLLALRNQKQRLEEKHPNAIFDIGDPEAQRFFYILRSLIRRNDSNLRDNMLFLLEIPRVKSLAHVAVTPHQPNELLRLALSLSNPVAAELLLNISAVRQLAEAHRFYCDEMRGELDLAVLARDRESSMTALSQGEQQRLQSVIDRYQPRLNVLGTKQCMTKLHQTLARLYQENSARVEIGATCGEKVIIALPLSWQAFRELNLTPEEQTRALQAYHQNKYHNALRYLSKPNPWMHSEASYIEVNPENPQEKWSTFEEYQSLISLLYLAVIDEETPPTDGYTFETRLEHFIEELALIGRAHNWDDTRIKMRAQGYPYYDSEGKIIIEEYDNLEGDRPSCFTGVKRRLFQSVQGHPLLVFLTKEKLEAEIRDFVREHFQRALNDCNRQTIQTIWDKVVAASELDPVDWEALKALDISTEKQQAFRQSLFQKYGTHLEADQQLAQVIQQAFALKQAPDAHILHFSYLHLEQFFKPQSEILLANAAKPSQVGLFAQTTQSPTDDAMQNPSLPRPA